MQPTTEPTTPPTARPMGRLILVSNRLPVILDQGADGLSARVAAGGLATGLSGPHQRSGGRWIGWPGVTSPDGTLTAEMHQVLAAKAMDGIGLTAEQHERYYTHISNRCLWPLFHYFPERVHFDAEDWKAYQEVNHRFAEVVLEKVQPDDLVFVQDFHLTLLPGLLRLAMPQLRIGFFLHIPFPSSEIFRIFAEREAVLDGILGADMVGFHTLAYVRHFRSAVSRLLGAETRSTEVQYHGRRIRLLAQPLGIDPEDWQGDTGGADVEQQMKELRAAAAGRRIILGVERLDYTKGVPERLRAFGELLSQEPGLVDEIMMIQIAVPSRVEAEEYRDLKNEVDRIAGDINSRHGRPGLQALHYQYRGVPPHVLRALYRIADVCLVTPLRDGLNLVAKEFVASRSEDSGVLVLSENIGAAWELGEALRVNPYDPAAMVACLRQALAMPLAEQRARMQPMRMRVERATVHVWAENCIDAIASAQQGSAPPLLEPQDKLNLDQEWLAAERRTLFLDYDGTLREFTDRPEQARPTTEVLELLGALSEAPATAVWVISGRPAPLLQEWLGATGVGLIAEHGAFLRRPGDTEFCSLLGQFPLDWKHEVRALMEEFAARVPGSRIEEKPLGIAWHYREANAELAVWQARELYQHLEETLTDQGLEVQRGSRVVEVRPAAVSKGRAALEVLQIAAPLSGMIGTGTGTPYDASHLLLALGDDRTDESMFRSLPASAWTVLVGSRGSSARWRLPDPAAARSLLASMPVSSPTA